MLKFDGSFFEAENREDFDIIPMVKRAWAVELEVLSQVARVCRKYNISYYAAYGSLLGAVRHSGFIPWDDDIDISLKRKDYEKLLRILPSELPEGYVVESYYNSPDHQQPWAAVMNTRHILTDREKIKQFYNCPYICGIDIFPIDFIPSDLEQLKLQVELFGIVWGVALKYDECERDGELYQYVAKIEELCGVNLNIDETLRQRLFLLADQIAKMYEEDECQECTIISSCWRRNDIHFKFRKEWFERTVTLPFEVMEIDVPQNYEEVVKIFFGENYMIPIRFDQSHDYPFYKKQQEYLETHGIRMISE